MASPAAAKNTDSLQQSRNPSDPNETVSKKSSAAGKGDKRSDDAVASSSTLQVKMPLQTPPVVSQAPVVPAQASGVMGGLPSPLPEAEDSELTTGVTGDVMPAATTATQPLPDGAADNAIPASGLLAATAGQTATEGATASPPSTSAASSPSSVMTSAVDDSPRTTANADAGFSNGSLAVAGEDALPMVSPGTVQPAANASDEETSRVVVGSANEASLTSGGLLKTGVPKIGASRTSSGSAQAFGSADHDGKDKVASSTATATDGGENKPVSPMVGGSSPEGNRNDSQQSQAVELVMAQQSTSAIQPAVQSVSSTPDNAQLAGNPGTATTADVSAASSSGGVPETGTVPVVNSAQLIQSVRHAEMRLGMQSEEFGSMSISTSMSKQSLSAQIFTDHAELGRALAVHLPAMEQKLSTAYGLQAKVEINGGDASSATSAGTSSGQQSQGGRAQSGGSRAMSLRAEIAMPLTSATSSIEAVAANSSRLDIQV